MKYLTVEDVLLLHQMAIDEAGGTHGLRSLELLDSAVNRCRATFGGKYLYKSIFDKAASLTHSIIKNHPFVDGNKRTGMYSAMTFLELNGYKFKSGQKELVDFAISIDLRDTGIESIAEWFKVRCHRLKGR